MYKIKVLIVILCLLIIYLGVSYILLDVRIIYTTSFNESALSEAKSKELFVTNDLEVEVEGDSLKMWFADFDIWTSKRFEVKYFGILFHWTFYEDNWRYLNIKVKENSKIPIMRICVKKKNIGYVESCCNRIATFENNIETVNLVTCKEKKEIGYLRITIK